MTAFIRAVPSEVLRPGPVVERRASQTALGELGKGVAAVGDMFNAFEDEFNTAEAKAADSRYSDMIRETLYGEQNGFMYQQGGNAAKMRDSVAESIDKMYNSTLEGLPPMARIRAESAMEARRQRALSSIDQHTAGAQRQYLNEASGARVESLINDAIYNPSQVSQSITTATEEIEDMAAREGWAPEVTELKVREARTAVHSGVIERLETVSPRDALQYLYENRDDIEGSEVARLEGILVPAAKRQQGREKGRAAAEGQIRVTGVSTAGPGTTTVTLADGQVVERKGTRAWRNNNPGNIEFGDFARKHGAVGSDGRFAVFPTYEAGRDAKMSLLFESGSYRDLTLAAAISRYAPDNENDTGAYIREVAGALGIDPFTRMSSLSPDQREAMLDAMERVEGFEVGKEIGGSTVSDQGIDSLLNIEDPDERDAAINEYNLRSGVRQAQTDAAQDAAQDAAFRFIEDGGNIDQLPTEHRQNLGMEDMSALRTYQNKIASGETIQTDDRQYVTLTDMMATNPDAFVRQSPMQWRPHLSDQDFEFFVKKWGDMRSGETPKRKSTTISTVRTYSKNALEISGIDDPEAVDAFETSILRWANENSMEAQDPVKLKERIDLELTPIVLDPPGGTSLLHPLGGANAQSGSLFQIDFDGDPLDPNDDITPEVLRSSTLKIKGTRVQTRDMELAAQSFEHRFGRAPSVQEMIELLAASGLY